jgi:phosphatidyl-myo-inositol dimannoside synthase
MGLRKARSGTCVRRHLLVTNDFPPKVGGIQNYLWELWRRLPPDSFAVLTSPHRSSANFDRQQPFLIDRVREPVLLPIPGMAARIDRAARRFGADFVVLDPALPLGHVGPALELPYALVVHGAEVAVPGRLPISRALLARTLRGASLVVAAGGYPAAEASRAARRPLPTCIVAPGVDPGRFTPIGDRATARRALGLPDHGPLVAGLSRLVPRKGFDVVIDAVADLAVTHRSLHLAIAGSGRDRQRLERRAARRNAPVTFLGRLGDPAAAQLLGCADVFAMMCRNRWGGLEQEGFGIVFVEASAAGTPSVAGRSGGSSEAVIDGVTGSVVNDPRDLAAVRAALSALIEDPDRRHEMGVAARARACEEFSYDVLALRLGAALQQVGN